MRRGENRGSSKKNQPLTSRKDLCADGTFRRCNQKTTTQSTTRPVGRSRRVLPGRNLFRSSFGTAALKKKIGRSTVETQHGTRNLIGNALTSIESCDCSKKKKKTSRWQERRMWNILRRRHPSGRSNHHLLKHVNWACSQREAEVDSEPFQPEADLFRRITTTEVTNEEQKKNQNSSRTITAWRRDKEGHAKKCVPIL